MTAKQILVVDDEIGIRELLSEILFDEGYQIELAENAQQAREFRIKHVPDLVLLDIWMPDTDGLTLLKEWVHEGLLTMPVVMMSGHGTIETALEATRIGAVDFLEKPIALQKLLSTVAKVIQQGAGPLRMADAIAGQGGGMEPALTPLNLSLDLPLREAREKFESVYFSYQMTKESGNVSRVADNIGIERTHLYRKLKQLGIKIPKKEQE